MTDHPQALICYQMTNPIPPRRESSHLNDINIITHLPPALCGSHPGWRRGGGDIHITSWLVCIYDRLAVARSSHTDIDGRPRTLGLAHTRRYTRLSTKQRQHGGYKGHGLKFRTAPAPLLGRSAPDSGFRMGRRRRSTPWTLCLGAAHQSGSDRGRARS